MKVKELPLIGVEEICIYRRLRAYEFEDVFEGKYSDVGTLGEAEVVMVTVGARRKILEIQIEG